MPYTRRQELERSAFAEFRASLPSRPGTVVLVCPRCWRNVREYATRITALNAWAFKDGVLVEIDGSNCNCQGGK